MPPEVAAHVNWLQGQVQNLSGQIFDAREKMSAQESAQVRAEIAAVNANILNTIQQWHEQQRVPAASVPIASAEPPPKPKSFIEQVNELKEQAAALEGLKTAFGGGPQPAPAPVAPPEPIESSDDPVQMVKADDGTVAIIDRKTGEMKFGQSAFMNVGMLRGLFSGIVSEIKDAAIEVKRTQPQGTQQTNVKQQEQPPPRGLDGGSAAWKKK